MQGVEHILFPVDFSHRCHVIRPFVKSAAQAFGAKVTLLYVIEVPGILDIAYQIAANVEATSRQVDGQDLAEFFNLPDPTIPGGVEIAIEIGDPASVIARYAEKNGVDLIMMPTHGHGKFRSLLLGSVTAKVLHDVACPVWIATHTEDPPMPNHAKCESILCAMDLTAGDVQTLRRSVELAGLYKADLRLVHAVPDAEPHPRGFDENFRSSMREWARDELAKLQREAGTNFEACVESGSVPHLVRQTALQYRADLVVIGRGKLHKTLGRLRTHAYGIVRDSPCSVLSL